ncbi:protein of unknown function, might belong to Histidine kinase [Moritella yayanosii]|uniref:Uncharacterized protein n=2 Tax=Moritella yayanosii TaxID=69539 RepID=A0A330LVV5_9GAMM|nr:protein of unknown function, might belong to Histidine kinase [Moritella yayanosii]
MLHAGEMPAEDYDFLWSSLAAGNTWRGEFYNSKNNGELFGVIASIAAVKQRIHRLTCHDTLGHDTGDLLLVLVLHYSQIMLKVVRSWSSRPTLRCTK